MSAVEEMELDTDTELESEPTPKAERATPRQLREAGIRHIPSGLAKALSGTSDSGELSEGDPSLTVMEWAIIRECVREGAREIREFNLKNKLDKPEGEI